MLRRALLRLSVYTAPLVIVIIAGFLAGAVGIWAAILWGLALLAGLALYLRQRSQRSRGE